VADEAGQPGTGERVGHEGESQDDERGADVASRSLQQQRGEEHADDHVQALGIVHHGHPACQPLVVPDEMRGAEQGQQRQGAVEPAPGPLRREPGCGLGRVGGRLGQEPERDGEGHVHRELDQQVVEAGVGGVELEG